MKKKILKQKIYKERDNDDTKGKIKYRLRKQLEQEATQYIKEYTDKEYEDLALKRHKALVKDSNDLWDKVCTKVVLDWFDKDKNDNTKI